MYGLALRHVYAAAALDQKRAAVKAKLVLGVERERAPLDALLAGARVDGDVEQRRAVIAQIDGGEQRRLDDAHDLRRLHAAQRVVILARLRDQLRDVPRRRGEDLGDDQPVFEDADLRPLDVEEGEERPA